MRLNFSFIKLKKHSLKSYNLVMTICELLKQLRQWLATLIERAKKENLNL